MSKRMDKLLHDLARFEGVFCSGFFIPDPSVVTALALLFDRTHFLNGLEYVINLSKYFKIGAPNLDRVSKIALESVDPSMKEDPLASLTLRQKGTVYSYLYLTFQFFAHYAPFFPEVFCSSLLPQGELFNAKLIKKGKRGQLNTYKVSINPLMVCTGKKGELNRFVSEGKIPILGDMISPPCREKKGRFSAAQIASALAIESVVMIFPGTKGAEADTILEARERLRDHLPPFWSAMLKLSAELSDRLGDKANAEDLQREVDHAVSIIVRPALIDLIDKMEKERKQWFNKILSPVVKGLRVLAGKPPVDLAGLISSSLTLGTEVSLNVAQQLRKVEALKQESGLTYIIELRKTLDQL